MNLNLKGYWQIKEDRCKESVVQAGTCVVFPKGRTKKQNCTSKIEYDDDHPNDDQEFRIQ